MKDMTKGGSGEYEDYGLYTQVEQINKTYLKMHGLDKNGQLYKVNFFEFQRYEDISDFPVMRGMMRIPLKNIWRSREITIIVS